jgi:ubiquinone/menaquinone biosynthesis C-methylase UbiE
LVSHLARHFDSVAGVDYSIGMLQEARRLTAQTRNVNLAKMDAERLAFGPAAFDFVLAASLLHHVRPSLALSEAVRVLRPGGRLLVVESLRAGPRGAARPSWRRRGMRMVRAVGQWTRLARRLGATDALRWMRRWGRHTAGERLLTPEEWTDLAGSVPGCDVGVLHTYVYLLWDRPPTDQPLVSAATSLPS